MDTYDHKRVHTDKDGHKEAENRSAIVESGRGVRRSRNHIRWSQRARQPPSGASNGSWPGESMSRVTSGCRGHTMGSAGPTWPLVSISSSIDAHVALCRRFAAFPRIYWPCFALDKATLTRLMTLRKPIGESPAKSPEFLTRETMTILASSPWNVSTVPSRI